MAEGNWHRGWKEDFGIEFSEKTIGNNRADIVAPDGTVIELQHSSISEWEIAKRESAYGKMAWIVDSLPLCGRYGGTLNNFGLLIELRRNEEYEYNSCKEWVFNDRLVFELFGSSSRDQLGHIVGCPICRYKSLRLIFKNNIPFIKCENGCNFLPIERILVNKLKNKGIQDNYFQEIKNLNELPNITTFKYKLKVSGKMGFRNQDYIYSNYPYAIRIDGGIKQSIYQWIGRKSTVIFDLHKGNFTPKYRNKTPQEISKIENKPQNNLIIEDLAKSGTYSTEWLFWVKETINPRNFVLGGYLLTRQSLLEFFKKGTYAENNRQ